MRNIQVLALLGMLGCGGVDQSEGPEAESTASLTDPEEIDQAEKALVSSKAVDWGDILEGLTYQARDTLTGPDCGRGTNCFQGDKCVNPREGMCSATGEVCNARYDSSFWSNGPKCGLKSSGGTTYQYACREGDACVNQLHGECEKRRPCKCGAYYDSYAMGIGPFCGTDTSRGYTQHLKCNPRDLCAHPGGNLCKKANVCPGPTEYHARQSHAKGPECGVFPMPGYSTGIILHCEKGDACVFAPQNLCLKNQ